MSESAPFFSIVMATLNADVCVEESLRALSAQTAKNWELIVVDGGSSDQTISIIESAGIRNLVIIQGKDSGIYDAMNKGIAISKGEWIYFLNAGDKFSASNVLETIQHHIYTHSNAEVTYGNIEIGKTNGPPATKLQLIRSISDFFCGIPLCHQAAFYRNDCFKRFGNYSIDLKICADYEHMLRLFKAGCIFSKCEVTVATYQHGGYSHNNLVKLQMERVQIAWRHFPIKHQILFGIKFPILIGKSYFIRFFGTRLTKD